MSAAELLDATPNGDFGVAGLRLVVEPDAKPEALLDAATLLLNSGLAALADVDETEDLNEVHIKCWPASYLLRQAAFALGEGHSRLLKRQNAAKRNAKGGAA